MKALLAAVLSLMLSACGTIANLGIDPARLDTANKQLAAYGGEIIAIAQLAAELNETGVLSDEQTTQVAEELQAALNLAVIAQRQLEETGDPRQAEQTIDRIARSIDLALGLLTAFAPEETSPLQLMRVSHVIRS